MGKNLEQRVKALESWKNSVIQNNKKNIALLQSRMKASEKHLKQQMAFLKSRGFNVEQIMKKLKALQGDNNVLTNATNNQKVNYKKTDFSIATNLAGVGWAVLFNFPHAAMFSGLISIALPLIEQEIQKDDYIRKLSSIIVKSKNIYTILHKSFLHYSQTNLKMLLDINKGNHVKPGSQFQFTTLAGSLLNTRTSKSVFKDLKKQYASILKLKNQTLSKTGSLDYRSSYYALYKQYHQSKYGIGARITSWPKFTRKGYKKLIKKHPNSKIIKSMGKIFELRDQVSQFNKTVKKVLPSLLIKDRDKRNQILMLEQERMKLQEEVNGNADYPGMDKKYARIKEIEKNIQKIKGSKLAGLEARKQALKKQIKVVPKSGPRRIQNKIRRENRYVQSQIDAIDKKLTQYKDNIKDITNPTKIWRANVERRLRLFLKLFTASMALKSSASTKSIPTKTIQFLKQKTVWLTEQVHILYEKVSQLSTGKKLKKTYNSKPENPYPLKDKLKQASNNSKSNVNITLKSSGNPQGALMASSYNSGFSKPNAKNSKLKNNTKALALNAGQQLKEEKQDKALNQLLKELQLLDKSQQSANKAQDDLLNQIMTVALTADPKQAQIQKSLSLA